MPIKTVGNEMFIYLLFYLGMQLVSHPKERTKIEDVWEEGAEHKFSI
jgi:hypothetical protein